MATRTSIFATNDTLTADDLNSLAGAWNSYTPTITGWTKNSGTVSGGYLQCGKLVFFRAKLVVASDTVVTGGCEFSLPVTSASATHGTWSLVGGHVTDGAVAYQAAVRLSSAKVTAYIQATDGKFTNFASTTPFTWAADDTVQVAGVYEAA